MNTWKITVPLSCLVTSEASCYQGFKSMKTRYNVGFPNISRLFSCLCFVLFPDDMTAILQSPHHENYCSVHLNAKIPYKLKKLDLERKKITKLLQVCAGYPLNKLFVSVTSLFTCFGRNLADSSINSWLPFSRTRSLDSQIGSMSFG